MSEMDQIDILAAQAFEGYTVRKDLVRRFKQQYPVPTYVVEFLLGKYCATIDESEIQEGLQIVESQLGKRAVRAGEEQLFQMRAKEEGSVRIIDLVSARLDAATDSYLAELPSLRLRSVRIPAELVREHERMLTGGFYAEVELRYDAAIAQEKNGLPFGIDSLRAIQLSKLNVIETLIEGRKHFNTTEWKQFLLRSTGLEPGAMTERQQDISLLRMVPFVERNFNLIELGPRGTGKSHLFQQVSPYSHLVSGGKATVARMFVNNASGQRGLVCQFDVVCFDEISGISFDQKDGVNIMKGYMESGEFSRGKESIRAEGSVVMVGNFDVDVATQQRVGHLFGPLPPEMRNDTAFMDRIHCYLPGWDIPKLDKKYFSDHFGLVSDFLSECWTSLRRQSRASVLLGRVHLGGALSGRDTTAVTKTVSGLLKLIQPDPEAPITDEELEWALRLALECRRRVKEQQKRIGAAEFRNTQFSYTLGLEGVEQFVSTPEIARDDSIGGDPLPPGQVWAITPGTTDEHPGLFRIEANTGPGSGAKILNHPVPPSFRESVRFAEQNLYTGSKTLVGDRDPRHHEFSIQLRAFDAARSGAGIGLPTLLALCSALLEKSLKGGLIAVGSLNLGGTIDPVHNPVSVAELAIEKQAAILLLPISARRQLFELPDEQAAKIDIQFYTDVRDALIKAIAE
jgi:ATP-dependent Lon protease